MGAENLVLIFSLGSLILDEPPVVIFTPFSSLAQSSIVQLYIGVRGWKAPLWLYCTLHDKREVTHRTIRLNKNTYCTPDYSLEPDTKDLLLISFTLALHWCNWNDFSGIIPGVRRDPAGVLSTLPPGPNCHA